MKSLLHRNISNNTMLLNATWLHKILLIQRTNIFLKNDIFTKGLVHPFLARKINQNFFISLLTFISWTFPQKAVTLFIYLLYPIFYFLSNIDLQKIFFFWGGVTQITANDLQLFNHKSFAVIDIDTFLIHFVCDRLRCLLIILITNVICLSVIFCV